MSIAWTPDPSTACVSEPKASTREWRPVTETVASERESSTTFSDALSLRRRQSPRGDPATAADPDVTRRSRDPDALLDPGAAGLHDSSHRAIDPADGEQGSGHLGVDVEPRIHTHGEAASALPGAEAKPLGRRVADDEHVALALDAVRAVHHEQLGDLRIADDLDSLVRGPHAHAPRARGRCVEQPRGLGRIEPAGRDCLEHLAPAHAVTTSPIAATNASSRKSSSD